MTKFTNFLDDAEKMHDFFILSKEEFLKSYSYLNEKEWELTNKGSKKIRDKIINTARKFKDEGEGDIWHTIWHEGVPYDMHLMLDQSLEDKKWEYEVLVYPVLQDENGEWTRGVVSDPEHCDILLFKHTFPYNGEGQ